MNIAVTKNVDVYRAARREVHVYSNVLGPP